MEIGQAVLDLLYGLTANAYQSHTSDNAPRVITTLDPDVPAVRGRLCIWQFFKSSYTAKRAISNNTVLNCLLVVYVTTPTVAQIIRRQI
jgi:hypothetical protein